MVDKQSFGGQKMSLVKSLSAVAVLGIAASSVSAAITPRWVQNEVPGTVLALPTVPDDLQSWSLVVDLTGASLYNVSNLKATLPVGGTYYNHAAGGNVKPNPVFVQLFPDLAFDTYVHTTTDGGPGGQDPVLPGRAFEPGSPIVGTGRDVDVAWGATPNTGPAGGTGLEIARLSWSGSGVPVVHDGVVTSPANQVSAVFDSVNPNVGVPIPQLPEPTALGLAALGLGLVGLRRR
jgi:hypothetical protein